jgi:hypothetical protein
MRAFLLIGALLAPLALAACGSAPKPAPAPAPSPLEQLQSDLKAADTTAVNYGKLPRCGTAAVVTVCSDPATVLKLKAAADAAYAAVNTAQYTAALTSATTQTKAQTLADAAAKVAALQQIVNTLPVGG